MDQPIVVIWVESLERVVSQFGQRRVKLWSRDFYPVARALGR